MLERLNKLREAIEERRKALVRGLIAKLPANGRLRRILESSLMPSRVVTPTILQMEALECGAASLAIILAHFGRWVPLEKLRIDCGVSRDGSKASNVVKAARRYGLAVKGFKTEPKNLRKLKTPMIIHWNFNHFLVLNGFRGERVMLNDPAGGPREVTEEELDQSFTGVVLTFDKGPTFEPGGDPPKLLPALARRLEGSGPALAFVLLAGLALVIPGLAVPIFSKIFIDNILLKGYTDWLWPLLLGMGLTALIIGALTWLQQAYLLRLEAKMALAASGKFLWHILRLPVEFFTQRSAGDISARMLSNYAVARLLSGGLATNVIGSVVIVFYAMLMLQYDVFLTIVGVAVVSLNVLALRFVSRKRVDASRQLIQEQGKLQGTALSGLAGIESLKAMGGDSDLFMKWAGFQTKVVNIRQKLQRYTLFLESVPPFLTALSTALILGVGSVRVIEGSMTLGGLIAFQALMAAFALPVSRLVSLGSDLQTVEGDMNRLDDVLRYPQEPGIEVLESAPDPDTPVKLSGHLEIRDLTFGYSRLSPPLIEDFSLSLKPGQRVALVGGSGSGKSTVSQLVTGVYQPWSGDILFDGKPRSALPRSVMSVSMASVDQSIFLFEGSIRDNLTLWDSTSPLSEVISATKDACIHEDIAARPGGYDSQVTEGGSNWSGGQRQRLEIARALVVNPTLLVLDEATSALDPTTEQTIDENLRRRGCTCLIVAHRLSTIRDADEIIVLDQGKIVQRGTHDDLQSVDGPYQRLIAAH